MERGTIYLDGDYERCCPGRVKLHAASALVDAALPTSSCCLAIPCAACLLNNRASSVYSDSTRRKHYPVISSLIYRHGSRLLFTRDECILSPCPDSVDSSSCNQPTRRSPPAPFCCVLAPMRSMPIRPLLRPFLVLTRLLLLVFS